jgi:hypothetical protein
MKTDVALVKLLASRNEGMGYMVYVFECLEFRIKINTPYIMCTKFPNWDHRELQIGEIGFLEFKEIIAGKTTWFDGTNDILCKHDNIQFIRFVEKPKETTHKFTV